MVSRPDRKHFSHFLTILLEKLFVNSHLFCWNVYCATAKQIALASSAEPDELKTNSEIANVDDLIQGETSSGNVEKSKPCRDIFEEALEQLGNPPANRVIVIGDT